MFASNAVRADHRGFGAVRRAPYRQGPRSQRDAALRWRERRASM